MIQTPMTLNVVLENRLAAFIAELAISAEKLEIYRQDPEAAMAEAGLDEKEKEALRGGDWETICEALGDPGRRPMMTSQSSGGEGQGTGSGGA